MRNYKTITRIFSGLLSAAVILPGATLLSPVAFASGTTRWTVNTEQSTSLPSPVQAAFDDACASYTGEPLVPLACYGIQVVAGYNYYLICRQGDELKRVVIYTDIENISEITSVSDFKLEDHAKNNSYELPLEPVAGGVEVYTDQSSCTLTGEAGEVFNAAYEGLTGVSVEPLAYLGKTEGNDDTYAYICLRSAVVPYPDHFVDIITLKKEADNTISEKTVYTLLGSLGGYSHYEDPLENTSEVNSDILSLGSRIYMTGSAAGGHGEYSFDYYYKRSSSKRWISLAADGAAGDTVFFTPKAAAEYQLMIVARDGMGNTSEITKNVSVTDGSSDAFENLSTVSAAKAMPGTRIVMNGAADGSSGYRYAYYYKRTTAAAWKVLGSEFSQTSSAAFTPKAEGDFNIKIDIIDNDGNLVSKKFDLTVTSDPSEFPENRSTISAAEVKAGTRVTVTGAAEGGDGEYSYRFLYKKSTSSKWTEMAAAGNLGSFKPKNTGSYDIRCIVSDSTGADCEKVFTVAVK